jgi:hypothetical protein
MFGLSVAAYGRDLVPALGRRWVCLTALSVGIIAFGGRAPVEAGLVLQSGTSTLQFSQGLSGSLDLVISNTGPDSVFVNYFWAGVQLVADRGATGSISLSGVAAPLTDSLLSHDPVFTASDETLTVGTTVGGTDYIQLIGANNSNSEDSLADGEVANLIAITFTASGDALGTWTLYGVNQSSSSVSYLSNVNDVQTGFDNVPATDDTAVALATIVVTVPEPGTISLLALGGLTLAGMHWRRRSRRSA